MGYNHRVPAFDSTTLARAVAIGRAGFGVAMIAQPRRITEPWIGVDGLRGGVPVLAQALGMRDLVIGVGGLTAPQPEVRRWLIAGLASDSTDLLASVAAGDALPVRGRVLVGLAAGVGIALGAAAVLGLPRS